MPDHDGVGPDPAVPEVTESTDPGAASVDLAKALFSQARSDAKAQGSAPGGGKRRGRLARAARDQATSRRTGARPDDRDPQPLGRSIQRLLAERGWETDAAVAGAMGRWSEIVGADIAEHVTPDRYEDTVLHVLADSTAWATQVRLLTPTLVRRLNEELGDGTVTRVQVHGPGSPSWVRGRLRVKGRGPRDTYG